MPTSFWLRTGFIAITTALTACGSSDSSSNSTAGRKQIENCEHASWVAGSTELCNGKLIYRDYVYDDYGADAGLLSAEPTLLNLSNRGGSLGLPFANTPGLLAPAAGDKRYPSGLENTADLVNLTLAIEGNELVVNAELNTLFNADDAQLAIAIDTDNDQATGGGAWTPLQTSSAGWDVLQVFTQGDPDTNRIVGRMSLPEGNEWRVQAAVAQKDGTVMNVAFRGANEEAKAGTLPDQLLPGSGNFWEDKQAAALGRGDISEFGFVVSVADMRRGVTRLAEKPTGFHQRVYTSKYTLGEGVSLSGVPGRHGDTMLPCEQYFNYLGKYQPYGVYMPEASPATPGVQVVMHGCEANHASQINQPNMQRQFGEGLNRILVSPLGRGNYGFYSDISERDVLDVLADIEATYKTDKDRTFISGYSMGGYGAMRLAALYPHRFAGLVSWVGFSGDITNLPLPINPLPDLLRQLGQASMIPNFASGASIGAAENIIDYLGNLRHVPGAYVYGGLDELVQVTTALAIERRLASNGIPYQFFLHPIAEHLTFMLLDDWQKEATYTKDHVRVKNPVQVTYRTNLASAFPEYDIVHDTAYWVSGIRGQREGFSDVDLTVPGCGGAQSIFENGQDLGPMPVPWVSTLRRITGAEPIPAQASIRGTLRNVSELEIDANATCLSGRSVSVDVNTDIPVILRLSDGRTVNLTATQGVGNF